MTNSWVSPSSPAPETASSTSTTARKIAMGSFDPDSTSSVERTRSRMVMPPTRNRKNTAAASVEETMEPRRRDSGHPTPRIVCTASPTIPMVTSTPTVASTMDGAAAWRKDLSEVPNPESNRMTASASEPTK